jgi:3'-phosphoadenosine 5'-phosphosulfate sulfotransferase (PAPS reductase)/FAD synthetase
MIVSWFSAGVSSAVATKLMIDKIDKIIYTHIEDQHPDTMRFVKECEQWFGKPVEILQSPYKYVENACLKTGGKGYINGIHGARCSQYLKKMVRYKWEYEQPIEESLTYVWGMDNKEINRRERLIKSMPEQNHLFPLIERNLSKQQTHAILKASGIKRPAMYELGYNNNNCIGCVKGGKGYWNHIRIDFPEVYQQRAVMERKVGHSCIKGVFLDELNPNEGRHTPPIVDDCGMFCDSIGIFVEKSK